MNADEILKIIQELPSYIQYIYPGYFCIYTYLFLQGKTLRDSKPVLIKSLALSYIFMEVAKWIQSLPCKINLNILLIIIPIFTAYFSYWVRTTCFVQWIFDFLKIYTTFSDNEFDTLSNYNNGAWLVIYLKSDDVVYEGSLSARELEDGKRKYIILKAYYKYKLDPKGKPVEPYIEDYGADYNKMVTIYYDDIKRIEKRV